MPSFEHDGARFTMRNMVGVSDCDLCAGRPGLGDQGMARALSADQPDSEIVDNFRVIAMDQRNAGGQSRAPITARDGWDSYTKDHIALLDHLRIDRCHLYGQCIGGSFILNLMKKQPERVAAAVLAQPIGRVGPMPQARRRGSRPGPPRSRITPRRRPKCSTHSIAISTKRVCVLRRSRVCADGPDAVPVLAGNDEAHPYAIAEELDRLLPNSEFIAEWKTGAALEAARARVKRFLADAHATADLSASGQTCRCTVSERSPAGRRTCCGLRLFVRRPPRPQTAAGNAIGIASAPVARRKDPAVRALLPVAGTHTARGRGGSANSPATQRYVRVSGLHSQCPSIQAIPGRGGSGRTSTRGGGGASGATMTVATVLPLCGSAGTSSLVTVVCFSTVTSAAKAGPAQIRAAPAIISTRLMDHLRYHGPRSRAAYRMNRVHLIIIPRCSGPCASGAAAVTHCGPMPIHGPMRCRNARFRSSSGDYGRMYMPGTQTCMAIGEFQVQCPGAQT